jgi:hypothetical protein
MVNDGAFGSLLFRGVDSMSIAGREIRTAVCGDEGESDGIFRKEMV